MNVKIRVNLSNDTIIQWLREQGEAAAATGESRPIQSRGFGFRHREEGQI